MRIEGINSAFKVCHSVEPCTLDRKQCTNGFVIVEKLLFVRRREYVELSSTGAYMEAYPLVRKDNLISEKKVNLNRERI